MKAMIFNGALERRPHSTAGRLCEHVANKLSARGVESMEFNIAESGIPLFDVTLNKTPAGAELMNRMFREADVHIWLAPLYHGSIPGVMKNCLDWLELSAKEATPYLTGKTIALVCWADGVQAMQGINAMDAVAKALRAWTLPYSLPIQRPELFDEKGNVSPKYEQRFDLLLQLLVKGKPLPALF